MSHYPPSTVSAMTWYELCDRLRVPPDALPSHILPRIDEVFTEDQGKQLKARFSRELSDEVEQNMRRSAKELKRWIESL